MTLPSRVKLVEVGPRDGLQNESQSLTADVKVRLIEKLAEAGVRHIESGSFVNPQWVPQMAGSEEIFAMISRRPGVSYTALTPNLKGYERARQAGVEEVAVFAAASEGFSRKNINCSIAESLERFAPVLEAAKRDEVKVRGYISCVVGCPYDGDIAPERVHDVATRLWNMGCYEISLGDTIGVGTPAKFTAMLEAVAKSVPVAGLAVHPHDTYGQALVNIYAALQFGVAVVDSSIAGLGGCPYARGASGNVATEDVVYMLQGLGIETGIDLARLVDAGDYISGVLGRQTQSRAGRALARRDDNATGSEDGRAGA